MFTKWLVVLLTFQLINTSLLPISKEFEESNHQVSEELSKFPLQAISINQIHSKTHNNPLINKSLIEEQDSDFFIYLPCVLNTTPSWKQVSSPTTTKLNDVYALSPNDVWVVGDEGLILHWDGNVWQSIPSPSVSNNRELSMKNESEGFAQTNSGIIKWDGISWTLSSEFITNARSNTANDVTNFWFVGGVVYGLPPNSTYSGEILKWNNTTQEDDHYYFPGAIYYGIDMISPTEGWAVGKSYTDTSSAIVRWNGTQWNPIAYPPLNYLTDVSAYDSSHAFSTGQDLSGQCISLFWNGSTWNSIGCPAGVMFNSVDYISTNSAVAVGSGGTIAYSNGSAWTIISSPVNTALLSVFMLSETEGWAVGENGVILHFSSGIN